MERRSRYERAVGPLGSSPPLSRQGLAVLAILAGCAWSLVVVLAATGGKGLGAAALLAIAGFVLLGSYVVFWRDIVIRVHRWLLQKPWGDRSRLGIFLLTVLAVPTATIGAILILSAVVQRM